MKILYIGGGYVGACSAAVGADSGHNVLICDIDNKKIANYSSFNKEKIESVIYEEGLADLFIKNKERIKFYSDYSSLKEDLSEVSAVFMCLPTPEKDESGQADLKYYKQAVNDLAGALKMRNGGKQSQYILIINKSTVPLGMTNITKEILDSHGVKNYGTGSNPEFLVEGKAIEGSISPQRVVVGAWKEKDFEIMRDIYKRFYDSPNTEYIEVNPVEAEAGKLLANYILFNRLATCFDVVGRTCEKFDKLHFENVRKILISDQRIGNWGFYDSLFAGGSCFIKDARSLDFQLREKSVETEIISDTLRANERQLKEFLSRPELELDYDWEGKTVGLLGLAFKRDTDDIRNSAALGVTDFLLKKKVKQIRAYDPIASKNYRNYYDDKEILIVDRKKKAMKDADVLIITTDWPQFRELTYDIKEILPKGALIMDGRRMLQHKYKELSEAGYNIISVGSPIIIKK